MCACTLNSPMASGGGEIAHTLVMMLLFKTPSMVKLFWSGLCPLTAGEIPPDPNFTVNVDCWPPSCGAAPGANKASCVNSRQFKGKSTISECSMTLLSVDDVVFNMGGAVVTSTVCAVEATESLRSMVK